MLHTHTWSIPNFACTRRVPLLCCHAACVGAQQCPTSLQHCGPLSQHAARSSVWCATSAVRLVWLRQASQCSTFMSPANSQHMYGHGILISQNRKPVQRKAEVFISGQAHAAQG